MKSARNNDLTAAHQESQDQINAKYADLSEKCTTRFARDTKAYCFTNEPFGDLLEARLNLDGPVLTITASGDPVCFFAGKGALRVDAVDVSKYANAWAEYKWHSFLTFGLDKFKELLVSNKARWPQFPFDLPVSEQARQTYAPFRENEGVIATTGELFLPVHYAGSLPNSSGYIKKGDYEELQQKAALASVRFYPVDFTSFFEVEKIPPQHYAAIYISNILDHTVNLQTGESDHSVQTMAPLITKLLQHLQEDGQLLLNIQWSNRAKPAISKALDDCDFALTPVQKRHGGCGTMYIATQKS